MATTTTRLGLRKPAGADNVNVTTDISNSMDTIDGAMGAEVVASFPVSPYTGKIVLRSDQSYRSYVWNGSAWLIMSDGPYAELTGTTTSIPDATDTPIPFATEIIDTDNGHSLVTNNSRYIFPFDGLYLVNARVSWSNSATVASLQLALAINGGSGLIGSRIATSSNVTYTQTASNVFDVNAGDYVEASVNHNTGVARALSTLGSAPRMTISFLRNT